ncbi:MAG: RNA polymerase sigma factor [Sporichthyaceae bacterium]
MSGDQFVATVMPALDVVHNLARRTMRNPADAEDLVQDTLAKAWDAWSRGTRPDSVPAWLSTVCLNLARDRARKAARSREVAWDEHTPEPVGAADVAAEAIATVQRSQIDAALWQLPEPQRVAIVLMDVCGLTAAEVAAVIEAPRGTVLARVHRGRKALAALVAGGQRPRETGHPPPPAARRERSTDTAAARKEGHDD